MTKKLYYKKIVMKTKIHYLHMSQIFGPSTKTEPKFSNDNLTPASVELVFSLKN